MTVTQPTAPTGRRSRAARWQMAARIAGWAAMVLPAAEAVARQLTRTRPIAFLPESPLALALIPAAGLALWVASGILGERPLERRRQASLPILVALFASGLALQLHFGARLQSDGFYYYAYLRSLAFDGDVNFLNDYALLGLGDKPHLFEPTTTGHAHSAWTIGPALVWAPFFAAGHVAASALSSSGANVAVDGASYPYRQAICIAGLFYALLGSWLAFKFAGEACGRRPAAIATALVIGGSFMAWYALVEPTMTHAPSMAAVAGVAWFWARTRGNRSLGGWALLGALVGLAALIRWQNAIFGLLPAVDAALALRRHTAAGEAAARRRVLAGGAVFTVAALVALLPQMLAWKAIYGAYFAVSPLGPTIDPLDPHLVDILFSSRNGLLAMSPVLYVAALGLLAFTWRQPEVGGALLAACAAMTWFNASIYDWWGSDGYGGRRFDGVVVLLVPGMAVALSGLRAFVARRPQVFPVAVLGGAILWNLSFMSAAHRGVVRIGEPLDFGIVAADQARTLHAWFGHPFSYPASLWFALRNGLSPAQYDLLSPARFLADRARPYGQIDIGGEDAIYVADGWHAPEREGDRTFRWASREAVLLVPLDHSADLDVRIRLRGFTPPGAPPQTLTLDLGRRTFGPVEVPADWDAVTLPIDRSAWRAGVTRLRLRFAWAARPADVSGSGDTRELAAAVDHVLVDGRPLEAR